VSYYGSTDHSHYGYADASHSHRGDYADERHDHDLDYAEKRHRHYDDESTVRGLREDLGAAEERIRELENDLRGALERIRALEGQTPQARQLQLEADQAAADLAESGYDREYDPGPEVDDEGGMTKYRGWLP